MWAQVALNQLTVTFGDGRKGRVKMDLNQSWKHFNVEYIWV
jgi:hypothetical protein